MRTSGRIRGLGNSRGFTLIELMIAMGILGFILAGVFSVFVINKRSYESQNLITDAQQNARFALDLLSRDVRSAGYMIGLCNDDDGVGSDADDCIDSVVEFEGVPYNGGITGPVRSINNDADGGNSVVDGTDVITLSSLQPLSPAVKLRDEHQPADSAANFKVGTWQALSDNNLECMPVILVNANRDHGMLFVPTNLSGGESNQVVDHNSGNCTVGGSATGYTNSTHLVNEGFGPGSEIMIFSSVQYYVENQAIGGVSVPCLIKNVNGATQRLAQNIEDLQLAYGFDITGAITYYNGIDAALTAGRNLRDLRMVRLTIVARTDRSDPMGMPGGRPAIEDHAAGAADNMRRRIYSTVVKVRNFGLE